MAAQGDQQQQGQQQQPRGILPVETLNALDSLVDRLNFSSGRLPNSSSPSNASDEDSSDDRPLPIRALLVGTNEGVGLSRSLGSAHTASQLRSHNGGDLSTFSHSGSMSEEVLSSIETVWATLVSAAPPHVMAATAAAAANNNVILEEKKEDNAPTHIQPPHPLLSPLRLGDTIRTVTATYDNCTLIHFHMPPLVVTFVTLPEANIGAIRCMALPLLKVLLEPLRRALVRSRGGGGGNVIGGGGVGVGAPIVAGMDRGNIMTQQMVDGIHQHHHQQQMMFGQQQPQHQQQFYGQQQFQQQQQQFQQQQTQQQFLLQQQLLNQQMLMQQQMYQDAAAGGQSMQQRQMYQQQQQLYMLQQQYQQQQQHQQF
jgi:hypothetical protein